MTAAYQMPGQNNTYVPSMKTTGRLVLAYSRNIEDFNINKYCQIIPVDQSSGLYLRMKNEECVRVLNSDLRDYRWADGTERPRSHSSTEYFRYETFTTDRYCYDFTIGDLASKQADWNIITQTSHIHAIKAMTARTRAAIACLTNTSNHEATHVIDVTSGSTNFGTWDTSITTTLNIKESITYGIRLINKDTLGVVTPKDLVLVISPDLAREIALSQEITDYLKHSEYSYPMVQGESKNTNNKYFGIPDTLYGVKVVVEDSIYISTLKGEATTRNYVLDGGKALLVARPGSIVGGAPKSPNFSSCAFFMKEEMTTEIKNDTDNRRTVGSIVDHWGVTLLAPSSAVLFKNLLSE